MNPRLIAEARDNLQNAALHAQHQRIQARESLYERLPRLRELDISIKRTMLEGMTAVLRENTDPAEAVRTAAAANLSAQKERAELLRREGIDSAVLEPAIVCPLCDDRMEKEGRLCSCVLDEAASLQAAELERKVDFKRRIREPADAREHEFLKWLEEYANGFQSGKRSLFLEDTPRVKSAVCHMMRIVAQKYFWVEYESASRLLAVLEAEKFDRLREEDGDPRRYYQCDLLILDDLGTEYTTAYVKSALFDLLNTRLNEHRTTVICSAVKQDDLAARYSPQVQARIQSGY